MKKIALFSRVAVWTTLLFSGTAFAAGAPANGHTVTVTVSPNPVIAGTPVTASMSCKCDDSATSKCDLSWTSTSSLTATGNSASGAPDTPGSFMISAKCNGASDSVNLVVVPRLDGISPKASYAKGGPISTS